MIDITRPKLIQLPVGKLTGDWEVYVRELFGVDKENEIFWMGDCKIQIKESRPNDFQLPSTDEEVVD